MAGVAWPVVKGYLVDALPAVLTGASVYDGPVVTGEVPLYYLTVGDQPSVEDASAGTFEQTIGPDGYDALETGSVLCELAVATGSSTVPDAFAAFTLLVTHLQGNRTLGGLLSPASTVNASAEVLQEQNTGGAVQRLLVSVNYSTRL